MIKESLVKILNIGEESERERERVGSERASDSVSEEDGG